MQEGKINMRRGMNAKIVGALALTLALTVTAAGIVGERDRRGPGENRSEAAPAPGTLADVDADTGKAVQAPVYPSFQDDFYAAVNGPELDRWEIPADQSQVSWFQKLGEANFERLDAIIREAAGVGKPQGEEAPDTSPTSLPSSISSARDRAAIAAMYLTGMDREARNRGGLGKAAGNFLGEVDEAATVEIGRAHV